MTRGKGFGTDTVQEGEEREAGEGREVGAVRFLSLAEESRVVNSTRQ